MTRRSSNTLQQQGVGRLRFVVVVSACIACSVLSQSVVAQFVQVEAPYYRFGKFVREVTGLTGVSSVAVADDGTIFVAQGCLGRVTALNGEGVVDHTWGSVGEQPGQFMWPRGIAASDGEVFITDSGSHMVNVFDEAGSLRRRWGEFGAGPKQFNQPAGIIALGDRVAVADTGNRRVQLFDRRGELIKVLGPDVEGGNPLRAPVDVALDEEGFVYVVDSLENRVTKFDQEGQVVKTLGEWGGQAGFLDDPTSIVFWRDHIHVVDSRNHRVQTLDNNGSFIEQWGVHETKPHEGKGKLHYPSDMAIASNGAFGVVCEPIEDRLQVFTCLYPQDEQELSIPYNKAGQTHFGDYVDIDGKLMVVAEPENHFVFVFDISGQVPVIVNQFGDPGPNFGATNRVAGLDVDVDRRRVIMSDLGPGRLQQYAIDYDPKSPRRMLPDMTRFAAAWDFAHVGRSIPRSAFQWPFEPGAIKSDYVGNLFMLDGRNHRVAAFSSTLEYLRSWGEYGSGEGQFRHPTDLAISKSGTEVFVVDSCNRRIQVYDLLGRFQRQWGGATPGAGDNGPALIEPFGVAAGRDGFVYVTDSAGDCVLRYSEQGKFVSQWGQRGTAMGQFWRPRGIAQDAKGRVFVIDQGNHRAQIFDSSGKWLVTFGAGKAYTPEMMPKE